MFKNYDSEKPDTIRGDIAKHNVGDIGKVEFPSGIFDNVKIKEIVQSYTDEYLDDYYIIDLPGRPNCWVAIGEFTKS